MITTDFRQMVVNHSNTLRPYAIALTRDDDDAQDLCQETMLRALLNMDKYRMGTNLKGWLYTIMRNIFINNYRRRKKMQISGADVQSDSVMYLTSTISYSNGYNTAHLAEIKKTINALPEALRTTFELYFNGYKYYEIAEILNEPLGTIKSRIHFARKLLSSRLVR
jgi:RNA polymerase sigma-70 factor (ECF subfamily)